MRNTHSPGRETVVFSFPGPTGFRINIYSRLILSPLWLQPTWLNLIWGANTYIESQILHFCLVSSFTFHHFVFRGYLFHFSLSVRAEWRCLVNRRVEYAQQYIIDVQGDKSATRSVLDQRIFLHHASLIFMTHPPHTHISISALSCQVLLRFSVSDLLTNTLFQTLFDICCVLQHKLWNWH